MGRLVDWGKYDSICPDIKPGQYTYQEIRPLWDMPEAKDAKKRNAQIKVWETYYDVKRAKGKNGQRDIYIFGARKPDYLSEYLKYRDDYAEYIAHLILKDLYQAPEGIKTYTVSGVRKMTSMINKAYYNKPHALQSLKNEAYATYLMDDILKEINFIQNDAISRAIAKLRNKCLVIMRDKVVLMKKANDSWDRYSPPAYSEEESFYFDLMAKNRAIALGAKKDRGSEWLDPEAYWKYQKLMENDLKPLGWDRISKGVELEITSKQAPTKLFNEVECNAMTVQRLLDSARWERIAPEKAIKEVIEERIRIQ